MEVTGNGGNKSSMFYSITYNASHYYTDNTITIVTVTTPTITAMVVLHHCSQPLYTALSTLPLLVVSSAVLGQLDVLWNVVL